MTGEGTVNETINQCLDSFDCFVSVLMVEVGVVGVLLFVFVWWAHRPRKEREQ